jgi:hypothetical protein
MPFCNRGDHKADRARLVRGSLILPTKCKYPASLNAHETERAVNLKCIRKRGVSQLTERSQL